MQGPRYDSPAMMPYPYYPTYPVERGYGMQGQQQGQAQAQAQQGFSGQMAPMPMPMAPMPPMPPRGGGMMRPPPPPVVAGMMSVGPPYWQQQQQQAMSGYASPYAMAAAPAGGFGRVDRRARPRGVAGGRRRVPARGIPPAPQKKQEAFFIDRSPAPAPAMATARRDAESCRNAEELESALEWRAARRDPLEVSKFFGLAERWLGVGEFSERAVRLLANAALDSSQTPVARSEESGAPSEEEEEGELVEAPAALEFRSRDEWRGTYVRTSRYEAWSEDYPTYVNGEWVAFWFAFGRARKGWWIGREFGRAAGVVAHCPSRRRRPPARGWHVARAGARESASDAGFAAPGEPREKPVEANSLAGLVDVPESARCGFGRLASNLLLEAAADVARCRRALDAETKETEIANVERRDDGRFAVAFSWRFLKRGDAVAFKKGDVIIEGTVVEAGSAEVSEEASANFLMETTGWRLARGPDRRAYFRERDALLALVGRGGGGGGGGDQIRSAILVEAPVVVAVGPRKDEDASRSQPRKEPMEEGEEDERPAVQKLLVLCDMNGTLLYRAPHGCEALETARPPDLQQGNRHYYVRAHARNFVGRLMASPRVNFAFYTSMTSRNAAPAAAFLSPEGEGAVVYAREFNKKDEWACHEWDTMRDLPKVWAAAGGGFDERSTVVVDDTGRKMREWPENVVVVGEYELLGGNENEAVKDDALLRLGEWLDALIADVAAGKLKDVREAVRALRASEEKKEEEEEEEEEGSARAAVAAASTHACAILCAPPGADTKAAPAVLRHWARVVGLRSILASSGAGTRGVDALAARLASAGLRVVRLGRPRSRKLDEITVEALVEAKRRAREDRREAERAADLAASANAARLRLAGTTTREAAAARRDDLAKALGETRAAAVLAAARKSRRVVVELRGASIPSLDGDWLRREDDSFSRRVDGRLFFAFYGEFDDVRGWWIGPDRSSRRGTVGFCPGAAAGSPPATGWTMTVGGLREACLSGGFSGPRDSDADVIEDAVALEVALQPRESPEEDDAALREAVLREAEVVCREAEDAGGGFEGFFFDDAHRASELATLSAVASSWGTLRRFALCGDDRQPGPSKCASLFERLRSRLVLDEPDPNRLICARFLDADTRAHPKLLEFPSRHAYDGRLRAATTSDSTPPPPPRGLPWPRAAVPVAFVEIEGPETPVGDGYANDPEARKACDLVTAAVAAGLDPRKIAVLAPYEAQVARILAAGVSEGVEVKTLENFAGRRKALVLFTATRSNPRGDLGRLADDPRRLTQLLTSAKRGVVVLGSADTLRHDPAWQQWLEWCESRALILDGQAWRAKLARASAANPASRAALDALSRAAPDGAPVAPSTFRTFVRARLGLKGSEADHLRRIIADQQEDS